MDISFKEQFKLPIFYNDKKRALKENIIRDLELVTTVDETEKPMYDFLVGSSLNPFSRSLSHQVAEFYTVDTVFLRDSQQLIKNLDCMEEKDEIDYDKMTQIWKEVKEDPSFKDKYGFLDHEVVLFLNKNEPFLQFLSLYNLASPIVSLMMPILVLIVPFILLKIRGIPLSLDDYLVILKKLIGDHAIGRLFTDFHEVDMQQKIYILASVIFYLFSIYQNVLACIKFHKNMQLIHDHFFQIREYLNITLARMKSFEVVADSLTSFAPFVANLKKQKQSLISFKANIDSLTAYEISYIKLIEIGRIMKVFYEFYEKSTEYDEAFLYSFGFNGYFSMLKTMRESWSAQLLSFAKFSTTRERESKQNKNKSNNQIQGAVYAPLIHKNPVKNDISFKKNIILTGPNAAGKTTVLKTALLNIIFIQQFGVGFFDSATIHPFDNIHCYLNIPDTSGRDSLFQAEARRCKEIIDSISESPEETHFCVFDELYSGTNPEEAVSSATAFMEYIMKNKNIFCMLTTHFVKVCKKLRKNKNVENYCMKTEETGLNTLRYFYQIEKGISQVKGGLKVLSEMNYPKEILDSAF